jgi:hypothetical protein
MNDADARWIAAATPGELRARVVELLSDHGQLHEGEPLDRALVRIAAVRPRLAGLLRLALNRDPPAA